MRYSGQFRFAATFLLSGLWFAFLIPWTGFADPDAFYHAKISSLLWHQGPIHSFPWLDLTLLGQQYADLHFGFHVFVAPFTSAFGMFNGLRIASVILAALFVAVFIECLRRLNVRTPIVWTAILLLTQPFVTRLLLGKATPLALIFFVLGLTAAWKRKPLFVGVITALFALSHGGWVYLAGSIILLAWGDVLYDRVVSCLSWRHAIGFARWKEICATFIGGLLGMMAHPNFPDVFRVWWTQTVTIGLGNSFGLVALGVEWLPADPVWLVTTYAPWIIAVLLGMSGLLFAARKPLREDAARFVASLGWIMAVLVALTLKSRRNTEYLAPVVALWCGALWTLIEPRLALRSFRTTVDGMGRMARYAIPVVVIACAIFLGVREGASIWVSLHPPRYLDNAYVTSMSAISARAEPGDRVFHSSWDEFPILFSADDRLRYVSGLDPTFLYVASSSLSDAVRDVTVGMSTSTNEETWSLIHDQLHSRFIFVSTRLHATLLERLKSNPRYVQINESPDSAAFEVRTE